ncbi:MAG: hypothetical protein LLG08_10535, partial [Actinomycetia bacterium]|nr:hypothetical protein [Actinomycetes bacterium]
MTSNLKAFVQGTALLTVSNIALKAMSFVLLPLYTAHLKPAELGVSDAVTNVAALVFTVMVLALDAAYGAFYYDHNTKTHRESVFNTIWFTMVWQSAIVLLLVALAPKISVAIFGVVGYSMAIRIALFGVMANLWYLPFALDVRIRNRMSVFAGVTLLSSLVMLLCNILFVAVF